MYIHNTATAELRVITERKSRGSNSYIYTLLSLKCRKSVISILKHESLTGTEPQSSLLGYL